MRGVKGSGPAKAPTKGRGRGKTTLADIAARSANSQTASDGAKQTASNGSPAAAAPATGRGRGRKSSGTANGKTTGRRGKGASATNGQQRADTSGQPSGNGGSQTQQPTETNGVKIETMAIPGRGGRPQQAETFPFAALDVSKKTDAGIVGPSFLIPDSDKPDNVLAAARKRHKGKSFAARKTDGGVRIWRIS